MITSPGEEEAWQCILATSWENLFIQYANNKGAYDVVRCLESIKPTQSKSKISRLAGLCRCAGRVVSYLVFLIAGLIYYFICLHRVAARLPFGTGCGLRSLIVALPANIVIIFFTIFIFIGAPTIFSPLPIPFWIIWTCNGKSLSGDAFQPT